MKPESQGTQDLAHADERMRSVVNHVVDGIISIDDAGIIITFNPAAERIFGYSADDVIGTNVKLLMPEPYRGEHDGYIANYLRTGQAKIIGIGREVVGKRKAGSIFPMELAISEFRLADRGYFTGIVRDITERKRAEEELRQAEARMRSVVDHVVDGIITIDDAGRIESFNPAAEKLFGYPRAEILGKNVNILMPEPYHGEHDGYLRNYLTTGVPKIIGLGREVVGKRKDGSTFPMELAVSGFHIESRRFFTGIVRDITERKQLEQELRQRLEELAEADRQKNDFLAMLAHELRNPMAPMRNALHLMNMAGADDNMVRQSRTMMERQLENLVRLVDDLLDVSRIIRGKIELRREELDIATAVMRAIETAQPVIETHGHRLTIELPEAPIWVEADLIRLSQVIANLLTNAAKYTDKAGHITLAVSQDDGHAIVRVRDTGIGISSDVLPRVFDLFVQADRSLARSQGGLGIGLTLVKSLIEMHGGTVTVDSPGLGCGSEFAIKLPVMPRDAKGDLDGKTGSVQPRVSDAVRRRVLVVDDNIDAANSIAMILRLSGYDVRCAYDGPAALKTARSYHPEVVVLDIGLPVMSGYEVARQLRSEREFEHVPLVAVTGYGQEEDRHRSFEAGFNCHLTKPVDVFALQAFISTQAADPARAAVAGKEVP
jgi:PAS domain S-box-containing protein